MGDRNKSDRSMSELAGLLAPGQRLLGLDPGEKNVGLALSDATLSIATPHTTLPRAPQSHLVVELRTLVEAEKVGGLVVGLPRNMDGSEGPKAQSARQLGRNLEKALAVPVAYWDERLSTAAVTRALLEADTSRRRRAEVVDKMAAAYILQGALDRIRADGKS